MALRPTCAMYIDVKQSPNAQDLLRPIPGLISCAGVTSTCTYMYIYSTCIDVHVHVHAHVQVVYLCHGQGHSPGY